MRFKLFTMKSLKSVHFILPLVLVFFLNACDSFLGKKRVLQSEIKKSGGLLYFSGEPFTGIGFDMWDEKQVKSEVSIQDGKITGIAKRYFKSGVLSEEIELFESKKNGLNIEYWENGNKRFERNYAMNKLNGEYVSYFKDGKVESKRNYLNGNRDGQFIEYGEDGKVKKDCLYKNDVLVGDCKSPDQK